MSSVFKQSVPIVLTSFINKAGQIGLNLIPILVIEKGFSAIEGSLVVGGIKTFLIVGTLVGGYTADKWGLRVTILCSFFLTAFGLGLIPLFDNIVWVFLLAIIAQIGHATFASNSRLLISELLPPSKLQEGIGWFRMGNNAGQIITYSLGSFLAFLGTGFFFFLDAGTSLLALIIGFKLIPKDKKQNVAIQNSPTDVGLRRLLTKDIYKNKKLYNFLLTSVIASIFWWGVETVQIGVAAKSKLIFGEDGLKYFSIFMFINTILCTVFAVPVTRWLKNIKFNFVVGTLLLTVGGILSLHGKPQKEVMFLGALFMTAGEIIFASIVQYAVILLTPSERKKGTFYGVSMIIQRMGVLMAGYLTLPLVVYGDYAIPLFLTIMVGCLSLTVLIKNPEEFEVHRAA